MTDPTPRLNTALEGRYRIERELGEGGMATVYLADDIRHDRKVAIKVLKPELAAVIGGERFLTEIKTTARLQHPHILPLFDSGDADGFLYYVMPYVEGETLRDRLAREKQLPVAEALRLARDVAEALEHAHQQGIIHRDIKPANILLSGGKPLVADFGIALAVSAAGGGRLTETGLSLGTPHYMSPEQATADRDPGPASDVYALGCVLYEGLVGEPPFTGGTAQAVLGKIISGDAPHAREGRRSIPAHVDAVIRRSLEKVPADRFGSAGEFAAALDDPSFRHGEVAGVGGSARAWIADPRSWAALAVIALLGGLHLFAGRADAGAGGATVTRFALPMTADELNRSGIGNNGFLQISPDGRFVAWSADGGGILVRDLEGLDAAVIPGTEDLQFASVDRLTWSPESDQLAFSGGGDIRRIMIVPRTGGVPRELTDSAYEEVHWSDDGWIYFPHRDGESGFGLARIRPAGGAIEHLPVGDVTTDVRNPIALPEGRGVLFKMGTRGGAAGYDLRDGTVHQFPSIPSEAFSRAVYDAETEHLILSSREGSMAIPFDLDAFATAGEPIPIPFKVMSVVADGTALAYDGDPTRVTDPVAILRPGQEPEILPNTPAGGISSIVMAPDGTRFAFDVWDPETPDEPRASWVYELPAGPPIRIAEKGKPLAWDPSGERVLVDLSATDFGPAAPEVDSVVWVAANGIGDREFVWEGRATYAGVTPEGAVILSAAGQPITVIEPDGETRVLETVDFRPNGAWVSPDGVWVAYQSTRAGDRHLWIRRVDGSGAPVRVSIEGGTRAFWSEDSRRLYYQSSNLTGSVAAYRALTVATIEGDRVFQRETIPGAGAGRTGPAAVLSGDSVFIGLAQDRTRVSDHRVVIVRNWRAEFRRFLDELGGG